MDAFVRVQYPGLDPTGEEPAEPHEELINAQHVEDDLFQLRAHSLFVPLGPGDIVRAPAGVITGVEAVSNDWIIQVLIQHDITDAEAEEIFERWRRDVEVTVTSPLTITVSTSRREWVDENVVPLGNNVVLAIDVLRRPGQEIDIKHEIENH